MGEQANAAWRQVPKKATNEVRRPELTAGEQETQASGSRLWKRACRRKTPIRPREHNLTHPRRDKTRDLEHQLARMASFACFCCCLKQDHPLASSSLLPPSSFFTAISLGAACLSASPPPLPLSLLHISLCCHSFSGLL